jgi:hypothetical protein
MGFGIAVFGIAVFGIAGFGIVACLAGYVLRGLLACQVVGSISLTLLQIRNLLQQIICFCHWAFTQSSQYVLSVSRDFCFHTELFLGRRIHCGDIFINLKQEKVVSFDLLHMALLCTERSRKIGP